MRKQKGITLIALIITIIILLILAGITISFMLGDNGLLNRTKEAGESYSEQAARERLELALADLTAAKLTDTAYNENQYIDDNLTRQDMIVNGDIVIVDGWQFEIDRSVPKIASSIGKGKENEQIQIEVSSTTSSDYVKATIQFKIIYTGEISSIRIQGEEKTIPTPVENMYTVEKEVIANGKYTIVVQDKEGNYQTGSIEITEITQDMEIWNKRDLETFRDRVNSGRSYQGRTVKVMADIDLQGSNWTSIGNGFVSFSGNFDGNYHIIKNIQINTEQELTGLFGSITKEGIVQNISVSGNMIATSVIGGIVGYSTGRVLNCQNYCNIQSSVGNAGGIVGGNQGIIENSCNLGTIQGTLWSVGGITGVLNGNGKIYNCYNRADITGGSNIAGIAGVCGHDLNSDGAIYNCYNTGVITGTTRTGDIVGLQGYNSGYGYVENCYTTTTSTLIGENLNGNIINCFNQVPTATALNAGTDSKNSWIEDVSMKNEGYPILKWQVRE